MTSPTPEGVYQALGPLRHATKELDAVRARNELAIIGQSRDLYIVCPDILNIPSLFDRCAPPRGDLDRCA